MGSPWRSAEANREINRDKHVGRAVDVYGSCGIVIDADDSGYVLVEFDDDTLRWVGLDHLQ